MSRVRTRRTAFRTAFAVVVILVAIVVMSTGLRAYAAEAFVVPSGSMLPTLLQIGDRVIVDKLSSTVHRGYRRVPPGPRRSRLRNSPTW